MKTLLFTTLLLGLGVLQARQMPSLNDTTSRQQFVDIIYNHRDRSYITAGGGFGNVGPLIFEGRLSPGFVIAGKKRNSALLLNPQVIARMDHRKSYPINSPSYKANLLYVQGIDVWSSSFPGRLFYPKALWQIGASHFSNGGEGNFYTNRTDKVVNFEDGSFSTDFLTLGITTYQTLKTNEEMTALRMARAYVQYHIPNGGNKDVLKAYGRSRILLSWKAAGLLTDTPTWLQKWRQHSGIEIQTGWIVGGMTQVANAPRSQRWTLDVSYHYYPSWFDEIAFFVRFYQGQDYYNIYFVNNIHLISFGINTNLMRPTQAVKRLGSLKQH